VNTEGLLVGKLRMSSIDNMIIWNKKVASIPDKKMFEIRVDMAFQEYVHYGKETYNNKKGWFLRLCKNDHVSPPHIRSFEENHKRMFDNWHRSDVTQQGYCPIPSVALSH
jgi:hypothetical protein